MSKIKTRFICQNCGAVFARIQGQCHHCGEWNSIVEEIDTPQAVNGSAVSTGEEPVPINQIEMMDSRRIKTGIGEFDRVTGGGIVPASIILVGGTPGIGKSTLLLSVADRICRSSSQSVLYVSGEESPRQIKLRAGRMGIDSSNLLVLSEIEINRIINTMGKHKPALVIIDSIQTMMHPDIQSAPGSVAQVRECAGMLQRVSKKTGIPVIVVGHVTKSGSIAGPMVLEHIVDAVLFFEGENIRDFRILRTLKNRFGSTQEIGVFSMETAGLKEVLNPSELFLSHHSFEIPGSVVVPIIEGTRTILIEIQALVAQTGFGLPARRAAGVPVNRVSVLLAVLEKRARLLLGSSDVYINVVGGVDVDEPAVDLGIALAVTSSLRDRPMPADTCAVGEIGLGGELRGITRIEERIREAEKMGFKKILIPSVNMSDKYNELGLEVIGVDNVADAAKLLFAKKE
ncbi:MAG: DNA repair protein RadA [Firmicutes bacterium]|nr:DNA repair protein RadA [Bacillota bacterium]